jgi:hypothetical protein
MAEIRCGIPIQIISKNVALHIPGTTLCSYEHRRSSLDSLQDIGRNVSNEYAVEISLPSGEVLSLYVDKSLVRRSGDKGEFARLCRRYWHPWRGKNGTAAC